LFGHDERWDIETGNIVDRSRGVDEAAIVQYITNTFEEVHVVDADGNYFFFSGPDRKLPFATLVTRDDYDQVSNLNRPSVFRLNIGVSKETYRSLLGAPPSPPGAAGVVETGHDFTALDQLMPHPVYGHLSWVCVLNPSDATFDIVRSLLAEAHGRAASKHAKRTDGG
jgi:hypothetical protein